MRQIADRLGIAKSTLGRIVKAADEDGDISISILCGEIHKFIFDLFLYKLKDNIISRYKDETAIIVFKVELTSSSDEIS